MHAWVQRGGGAARGRAHPRMPHPPTDTVPIAAADDDADLARDAASCLCAGNASLTAIGEAICRVLSPRLGEDPGVHEGSKVPELKAVCKVRTGTRSCAGEETAPGVHSAATPQPCGLPCVPCPVRRSGA